MRHEVAAGVNHPRTVDAYEATLNDARKDIKQRAKQQVRHGLVTLGNSPMERRRARAAQLLGDQWRPAVVEDQPPVLGRTERLVESEIERLRQEHRLEGAAARAADVPADIEEERRHEAFLAEQAAEQAEARRKAIAKANRSRFGKDEHRRRYGKDVRYRSGAQSMKDMTKEEDKRRFLKEVHDTFTARGGIVGSGSKGKGYAAGDVSMHSFAIERGVNAETMRQYLLTWEALLDVHARTNKWPQVRRARFAVMQGWRAGDPFPLPSKQKKEKLPKDLVDREPAPELDLGKVNLAAEAAKAKTASEPMHGNMIYSEGYKRRHGG